MHDSLKGGLNLGMHTQAVGKVHTLWTAFARFYERHGDLDNARVIFDKATQVTPAWHCFLAAKHSIPL